MDAKMAREPNLQQKASYYKALHDIGNQIHAAKDINEILINLREKILSLFDADRITIYVVDGKRKEVYSRFAAGAIQEIRVPINTRNRANTRLSLPTGRLCAKRNCKVEAIVR